MAEIGYTNEQLVDFMYDVMDWKDVEDTPMIYAVIEALKEHEAYKTIGTEEEFRRLTEIGTAEELREMKEKTERIESLLRSHNDFDLGTSQKNYELVKAVRRILGIDNDEERRRYGKSN